MNEGDSQPGGLAATARGSSSHSEQTMSENNNRKKMLLEMVPLLKVKAHAHSNMSFPRPWVLVWLQGPVPIVHMRMGFASKPHTQGGWKLS